MRETLLAFQYSFDIANEQQNIQNFIYSSCNFLNPRFNCSCFCVDEKMSQDIFDFFFLVHGFCLVWLFFREIYSIFYVILTDKHGKCKQIYRNVFSVVTCNHSLPAERERDKGGQLKPWKNSRFSFLDVYIIPLYLTVNYSFPLHWRNKLRRVRHFGNCEKKNCRRNCFFPYF